MVAPLVGMGIGAGLGALGSLFGGGGDQEQRQSLDPESQDYIRNMRAMAQMFAGRQMPGMDPAFLAAMQGMGGYAQAGQTGLSAMTDPAAAAQFMNPFMAGMNPMFDRLRSQSIDQFNRRATGAGAFGARRNLGAGEALRGVNEAQAQFSYQGFNDAMARAMSLAQMGMGANQWLGAQGQYLTDRPRAYDMGSLAMLQGGFGQPLYTSSTQKMDKPNLFQSMLGGAMTGLSFAGPGAGAGMAPSASARQGMSFNPPTFGGQGMYGFGNPWVQ